MGLLAIPAWCFGVAIILGVPFGFRAGGNAAAIDTGSGTAYLGGALSIYCIQTIALLAIYLTLALVMEGQLGADAADVLRKLRDFVFFSFLPILIWLPIFTITFFVSKMVAT